MVCLLLLHSPSMHGDDAVKGKFLWHGPRMWVLSASVGAVCGYGLTQVLPARYAPDVAVPEIPVVLVVPFALLLLSIALGPLVNPRWWHRHFPDIAFFLGALVATYYLVAYSRPGYAGSASYGVEKVSHAALEFYQFIALVGGLFVVSGGVLIELRGRAGPLYNSILLGVGAVLANIVGTTGASMLLIRPFMRANEGRLHFLHIVFFIFIVSNCGGCLTPIGDPPLYLGYIKGVPFFWTLGNLWADWLFTNLALLVVFFIVDSAIERKEGERRRREGLEALPPPAWLPRVRIEGRAGLVCLVLMIAGVFLDPVLHRLAPDLPHLPYGATFQVMVAAGAHARAPRHILDRNDFSFFPVKEVGLLFAGIFLTMMPALGYLATHGGKLGINSPTTFYYGTGTLSAVLDNAPTYLNFLQVAVPDELNRESIARFLLTREGTREMMAISTGAVFFGAMTYIGNGPNFMVRTIAESARVRMPSFFGYTAWACVFLLPVLVAQWWLFIR
jgi:Na+/H+ antiporter NhaD/arsenite permease-like protein